MSIETRLLAAFAAIGADIKTLFANSGGGGAPATIISETLPATAVEGQRWYQPSTGIEAEYVAAVTGYTWLQINGVSVAGASASDPLVLTDDTPDLPAAGQVTVFRRNVGGRQMAAIMGPSGLDTALQPHLGRNKMARWVPAGNSTAITLDGCAALTLIAGAVRAASVATTNRHTRQKRVESYLNATAANTLIGWRYSVAQWTVGAVSPGDGGFHYVWRWAPGVGMAAGIGNTTAFVGVGPAAVVSNSAPELAVNVIGMGWSSGDANMQLYCRGSGTGLKINLGPSFPVPTNDTVGSYELALFAQAGTTQSCGWQVTDNVTGATLSGTLTTNLPANTLLLSPRMWVSNTTQLNLPISIILFGGYIETDY